MWRVVYGLMATLAASLVLAPVADGADAVTFERDIQPIPSAPPIAKHMAES